MKFDETLKKFGHLLTNCWTNGMKGVISKTIIESHMTVGNKYLEWRIKSELLVKILKIPKIKEKIIYNGFLP
jgi:hypothetical protein